MSIPSAAFISIGISPLIRLVFKLDDAGTLLVTFATQAYLLGLASHSLLEIAVRSFYAQQNAKTPLIAAAFNAILYLICADLFSRVMGPAGIALATTFAFTSEAFLLLYLLNRKFPGVFEANQTILRVVISTFIISLGLYLFLQYSPFSPVLSSIIGLILCFGLCVPFILPEMRLLLKLDVSN